MLVTLDREWWADAQGNPVPYGDARGVFVLYGRGHEVSTSVAEALEASLKAIDAPPADKAVRGPRAKK